MEIRRTANAGILLRLDDTNILLDGVCRRVGSYLPTPPEEKRRLSAPWPDIVAFTHAHEDHFDGAYAAAYAQATGRPVYGPDQVAQQLAGMGKMDSTAAAGNVRVTAVPTRHMGHYGRTTSHQSYAVEGSRRIWFVGDASPTELKAFSAFAAPDVMVIPYVYVSTPFARRLLQMYMPCQLVLLHLPLPAQDPDGLWQAAAPGITQFGEKICLPELGQTINL